MFSISRFSELLKLLPSNEFNRAVKQNEADQHCKSFTSWRHLLAMVYLQLSGQKSLRTLEAGFNAQPSHHYHLDCQAVRRSTLSEANQDERRAKAFEQFATTLMAQAPRKLRTQGQEVLQLLDSTSITLKGPGYDEWVKYTRTPRARGIKLHVLLGLSEQAPLAASTTAANVNDIEYAAQMELERGVIYVFDKGYCNYSWWWKIQQNRSRFVTRFKSNARLQVVQERAIPKAAHGVILKDEQVRFANKNPGGGRRNPYTEVLRRIEVAREGKPPLVLATNDLKSSAQKIAERYKARWQIELFFKWIKQHLRIKQMLGKSYSAVRIQLFTALIAYLMVALYAKLHDIKKSLWLLLAELGSTLFQRPNTEWDRHRRVREQRADFASRQAAIFA
jgi:putative transposase